MEFRLNAAVFAVDQKPVGHVERVVLDPRTKKITHLVIRQGLIFSKDKVVPVDLIATAMKDSITLRADVEYLANLPDFEEEAFVIVDKDEYGPTGGMPFEDRPLPLYYYASGVDAMHERYPQQRVETEADQNIPAGTVALDEGAAVFSADGEHVGDIERIFTFPGTDRVARFLISDGFLLKQKKTIPATWITRLGEGEVHLTVKSHLLDILPPYRE
jgi:uncharacterized protein YrrD